MKAFKLFSMIVLAAMSAGFVSCDDDDDVWKSDNGYYYPNALVTCKVAPDNTFFLQVDDNTTWVPENITKSPYGNKEVRALVNATILDVTPMPGYTKTVRVNAMDSIRTKNTVPSLGERNDEVYGNDMVDVVRDWVNVAEDGYLTLRFRTTFSVGTTHYINVLTGVNPDDPYEVELRHNANGDMHGNFYGDALVAFNLKDLPDTEGKTVKMKLRIYYGSGVKNTIEFDYCTRKASGNTDLFLDGAANSLRPII